MSSSFPLKLVTTVAEKFLYYEETLQIVVLGERFPLSYLNEYN